jgi:hypothetical protein
MYDQLLKRYHVTMQTHGSATAAQTDLKPPAKTVITANDVD